MAYSYVSVGNTGIAGEDIVRLTLQGIYDKPNS